MILCNLRHVWDCALCVVIFYQTCIWNFCVLLAPRNKGQWRGKTRRGQNFGRFANQEHYRQQRDFSDRKDVYNQPQRRGAMPNRRPPSRGFLPTSSGSRKVIFFIQIQCNVHLAKVKFQADVVSGLLLKHMWSLGWPQGPLLILWFVLHFMLIFGDLLLKWISADSGSQRFPPLFGFVRW